MQVVIKIDEARYKDIQRIAEVQFYRRTDTVEQLIANGTPLPKGHGELVDIRPLMRGLYEEMCIGELTYTTSKVYEMLENEAPTIIDADKAESEEENEKM